MPKKSIALALVLFTLSLRAETARFQPWSRETSSQRYADEASRHIELAGDKIAPVKIPSDRAMRGKPGAPIQIVVYSDFQCTFCRNGFMTLQGLHKKLGDRLVTVYRHMPLDRHELALPAARRFEAIALISPEKAYRFHDIVFENQREIVKQGEAGLDDAAKKAGVDLAAMKAKLTDTRIQKRLDADAAAAKDLLITGTPAFQVNGIMVRGAKPPAFFDELIAQIEKPEPAEKKKVEASPAPLEAEPNQKK